MYSNPLLGDKALQHELSSWQERETAAAGVEELRWQIQRFLLQQHPQPPAPRTRVQRGGKTCHPLHGCPALMPPCHRCTVNLPALELTLLLVCRARALCSSLTLKSVSLRKRDCYFFKYSPQGRCWLWISLGSCGYKHGGTRRHTPSVSLTQVHVHRATSRGVLLRKAGASHLPSRIILCMPRQHGHTHMCSCNIGLCVSGSQYVCGESTRLPATGKVIASVRRQPGGAEEEEVRVPRPHLDTGGDVC